MSKLVKFIETETVVARGRGREELGIIVQWVECFSSEDEKVLEMDGWRGMHNNVHVFNATGL